VNNLQKQNDATKQASTANNGYVAPPENAEELNHLAYDDVLDGNSPTTDNEYYMQCYRFWRSISNHPNFDDNY